MTEIKLAAAARKITRSGNAGRKLMLTRGEDFILVDGKFPRLSPGKSDAQLRETLALIRSL